jgi:predicted RNA binding protein YcfA (HicA-like mRNA interferase family)
MPKIPRDLAGQDLCRLLRKYGYKVSRETGSHIRLISNRMGTEHAITVPDHNAIKIGTLNKILNNVCKYLRITKEDILAGI